jgi:uncharacterized repeat protein (TIGR03803 family)
METERWKSRLGRSLALATLALNLCPTAPAAPKYKVLHSFNGTDGQGPWGGVALDLKGSVYGASGGGTGDCRGGCGLVFQLTPHANGQWGETVLYTFQGSDDGEGPDSNVIFDSSGNVYGTTSGGGTYNWGTVFELTPGAGGWTEKVLWDFDADNGAVPTAGLIMDEAGNLYGTTPAGGENDGGITFELTPGSGGWNENVLNSFYYSPYGDPAPGGSSPYAGLVSDGTGNLYGTTQKGGTGCSGEGCGIVYELRPAAGGWKEIVLHRFHNNGKDGVEPGWGALFRDGSGDLYGTTGGGGAYQCGGAGTRSPAVFDTAHRRADGQRPGEDIGNCGTIFRLTKGTNGGWKETILYNFKVGSTGSTPNAGVVMDEAGNLYGTTDYGGSGSECGVIYKIAPAKGKWKYTVLHTFEGPDGCLPEGNLVLDPKGNLYGGTVLGGTTGNGVIFELTP